MLVLFVLLLFAIMGVAALVIDLGFWRLARRQIQTGVNAAAIEGLRNHGGKGRQNAVELAGLVYTDPEGAILFGAGPVISYPRETFGGSAQLGV